LGEITAEEDSRNEDAMVIAITRKAATTTPTTATTAAVGCNKIHPLGLGGHSAIFRTRRLLVIHCLVPRPQLLVHLTDSPSSAGWTKYRHSNELSTKKLRFFCLILPDPIELAPRPSLNCRTRRNRFVRPHDSCRQWTCDPE